MVVWREAAHYSSRHGSVRSWLLGLTHHKAVDLVRRETAQQRRRSAEAAQLALDPPAADPADVAWAGPKPSGTRWPWPTTAVTPSVRSLR